MLSRAGGAEGAGEAEEAEGAEGVGEERILLYDDQRIWYDLRFLRQCIFMSDHLIQQKIDKRWLMDAL